MTEAEQQIAIWSYCCGSEWVFFPLVKLSAVFDFGDRESERKDCMTVQTSTRSLDENVISNTANNRHYPRLAQALVEAGQNYCF